MTNEKLNVRNIYIDLLNKMKALDAVDQAYIDEKINIVNLLIAGLADEITNLDNTKADYDMFIASDSGNPLTLYALNKIANQLNINLLPIQDLHGFDYPWVGGAGKNKLPITLANLKTLNTDGTWVDNVYTRYNVEYTVITDDGGNVTKINVNGESNSSGGFQLVNGAFTNGNYILNGCPSGGSSTTYFIQSQSGGRDEGSGANVTISSDTANVYMYIGNGVNINKDFYPMLRLSTVVDDTFEPYTNFSPISGRTETTLTDTDGEDDREISFDFDQTVYGGLLDCNTGILLINRATVTVDDTWGYGTYGGKNYLTKDISGIKVYNNHPTDPICNMLPFGGYGGSAIFEDGNFYQGTATSRNLYIQDSRYNDATSFVAAYSSCMICYELATPIEVQLTPAELELFKGYNYITADGTIDISYIPENVINYIKSL